MNIENKRRNRFLVLFFKRYLKDRLSLEDDKADETETIEYIRKGVQFKGTNLWILIFAILIASVGLNVNSTAVIIGAMLISPLMGPIMGIGLGVGINDFQLIKRGLKNLSIAVGISVITSALYFLLSPLKDAQSELLTRTTPTIYDVLIAFFGGLTGIVAGSRSEKSNAIPGVAIATALMPPLCTAGYGLATFNFYYFFGAFYLFFINSVLISVSTYLIVRYMRYKKVEYVDPERERKVKMSIYAFVIFTILPSIYLAVDVVNQSLFYRRATEFITKELEFTGTEIISQKIAYKRDSSLIEVTFFGEFVDERMLTEARKKLPDYHMKNTYLQVNQGYFRGVDDDLALVEKINVNVKQGIIEDLYRRNERMLEDKNQQITFLENELIRYKLTDLPVKNIGEELKIQHSEVEQFSINRNVVLRPGTDKSDTLMLAYVKFKRKPPQKEINRMYDWLKLRTQADSLKIVIE
ncbi:MAG: TIGR00341 family protein [Cyclobacteriaceae bacterium]|nr:TIGR00341 family protein [Cyclobacteriaceae bacterium]